MLHPSLYFSITLPSILYSHYTAYIDYMNVKSGNTIGIIVGLANLIQWTTAVMLPVIQV